MIRFVGTPALQAYAGLVAVGRIAVPKRVYCKITWTAITPSTAIPTMIKCNSEKTMPKTRTVWRIHVWDTHEIDTEGGLHSEFDHHLDRNHDYDHPKRLCPAAREGGNDQSVGQHRNDRGRGTSYAERSPDVEAVHDQQVGMNAPTVSTDP
jgi:hypothetical protein